MKALQKNISFNTYEFQGKKIEIWKCLDKNRYSTIGYFFGLSFDYKMFSSDELKTPFQTLEKAKRYFKNKVIKRRGY